MMKLSLLLIFITAACGFLPHRRMDVCYSKVGVEGIWKLKEAKPLMILQNIQTEEIKEFQNDQSWQEAECP